MCNFNCITRLDSLDQRPKVSTVITTGKYTQCTFQGRAKHIYGVCHTEASRVVEF